MRGDKLLISCSVIPAVNSCKCSKAKVVPGRGEAKRQQRLRVFKPMMCAISKNALLLLVEILGTRDIDFGTQLALILTLACVTSFGQTCGFASLRRISSNLDSLLP